jgi:putative multiple sugar transport system substrate-binding protein
MENLLSAHYTKKHVDGVLSPYDGLSIGILAALKGVGYGTSGTPFPIITGQDSEIPSVKAIIAHEQYSSIFKDTRNLAKVAAGMVDAVMSGKQPEINDTKTYNNKVKIVPSFLLKPVLVDASNWKEVLVGSGYYKLDQLQ